MPEDGSRDSHALRQAVSDQDLEIIACKSCFLSIKSQLNLARVHGGQERLPTNGHPLINPSCLASWPDLSSTVQHSPPPPSLRSPPLESQSLPCFAVENHSCENGYGTLLSIGCSVYVAFMYR
ncbi:hypothetical protein D5086_007009 [Populus alba]|uniref:Uncharacterized protein n=1 Tax=Populus alba TaxID=43335 RepID=A0ACC4CNK7_POPAL